MRPSTSGVFFSTNGGTPVSGWSRAKQRLDAAMLAAMRSEHGADAAIRRLHDLRRTAVTGMAELGIAPPVIEQTVNHSSGTRAGVAGIYNRSELMDDRRAALEHWSAHVAGLVSGRSGKILALCPHGQGR